jgi:hypothetical protein
LLLLAALLVFNNHKRSQGKKDKHQACNRKPCHWLLLRLNKVSNDKQSNRAGDTDADFKKIKMAFNELFNDNCAEEYLAQVRKVLCKKIEPLVHRYRVPALVFSLGEPRTFCNLFFPPAAPRGLKGWKVERFKGYGV